MFITDGLLDLIPWRSLERLSLEARLEAVLLLFYAYHRCDAGVAVTEHTDGLDGLNLAYERWLLGVGLWCIW